MLSGATSGDLLFQLHGTLEMGEQPLLYRLRQNQAHAFTTEESVSRSSGAPLPFHLPGQRITMRRKNLQAQATGHVSPHLIQSSQALPQPHRAILAGANGHTVNDAHGNLLELNQYRPAAFRCNTWGAACGSAKAASPRALESSQAVASSNSVSGAISHLLDMGAL